MSGEREGEEDNQKDDFSVTEEFDFYFPFTKPLVLDLPTEEDRVLASAWVQKLEAEPETDEDKKERLNYLKLLLFVLQRGRLSGIFKKQPPSGSLEPFPQGFSIFDMANWTLEQDDTPTCGGDAGHVPYTVEMSNDLREFVASQQIPNFGVQMYYAWSSEEFIDKWSFFDEEKFPQYILDKLKQLQEIRSDEKSTIVKNGCVIKKRGCNLTLPEKYSQEKVKSPQEIERSQGRSFHTYMGLVGRMGNFNDKCDDDPKKFQRHDQRKGKCSRRSDQKKCPGSGGEKEEEEEDFDNLATNLDGLDILNRPCLCPYPCHHSACPEYHSKGRPQPNTYEEQQNLGRNCGFNVRSDPENSHWSPTALKPLGSRRVRESCHENEIPSVMPTQKRKISPRPRSCSPNRSHNLECSPEDNSGEFPNRNVTCTCNSLSCPCPCPRMPPKISIHKTPSTNRTGRSGADPSRTFIKSSKQDPCFNENRAIGTYLTTFNAPKSCSPSPRRPDVSPVGGRTNTSPTLRPIQPEVIHCYDNQNPDPALTKRIETNVEWLQTVGGGNRYINTDLKLASRRDQLIASAQQNKCKMASRRELFSSQQQSSAAPVVGISCQPPPGTTRRSPLLDSHPICDHSPSEEASRPCPSNQQGLYPYQNYAECEDPAPPQTCYGLHETCGRQVTDTYNQSGPQATTRVKNPPPYCPSSTFGVRNNTGRLANMTSVLQGIKQKTEAHREKCAQMRLPVNDMRPETGIYHSPQFPDPTSCSSSPLNTGYIGLAVPPQQCPLPSSPYPGYYPNRMVNFQQDECDVDYEEDDEGNSTESAETCPQEALPDRPPRNDQQSCRQPEFNKRDDSDHFRKTPVSGNYGVNFTEADQCYDGKYISPENACAEQEKTLVSGNFTNSFMETDSSNFGSRSPGRTHHRTPVNAPPRECGHQKTSPDRTLLSESCLSSSTREFKTMLGDSSVRTPRSQWVSPRVMPNEACINEDSSEPFSSYQESDMQNCLPQTPSHSTAGNRYFNESFKARSGQPYYPVTSTPIHYYKRNFKDQDDLSPTRPSSSRCA